MIASRAAWIDRLVGLAGVLAVFAGVELAVRFGLINGAFVPRPTGVALRTFDIVATGTLLWPLASTLSVTFVAYLSASAAAARTRR